MSRKSKRRTGEYLPELPANRPTPKNRSAMHRKARAEHLLRGLRK